MRKITKIEIQKRDRERFNIYLDDEYAFSINADLLVANGLSTGKCLDDDEIVELIAQDSDKSAFLKGLNYISYGRRTKAEVEKYLISKGFSDASVEAALNKLEGYKYIDDAAYAADFAKHAAKTGKYGSVAVKSKLAAKGISKREADEAAKSLKDVDEANAKAIAEKYWNRNAGVDNRKRRERVFRALAYRGYKHEDIIRAIKSLEDFDEE